MDIIEDGVTDGQFSSLFRAARYVDGERWGGEMTSALECCDRGWMEICEDQRGSLSAAGERYFVMTSLGAVVFGRERIRRMYR